MAIDHQVTKPTQPHRQGSRQSVFRKYQWCFSRSQQCLVVHFLRIYFRICLVLLFFLYICNGCRMVDGRWRTIMLDGDVITVDCQVPWYNIPGNTAAAAAAVVVVFVWPSTRSFYPTKSSTPTSTEKFGY